METWKDIPNYEGLYQVSNLGNVKSLYRKTRHNHVVKEKILILRESNVGYLRCNLSKNRTVKTFHVHVLVAMAFLCHIPCGNKIHVHHIDANKQNNNVSNLQVINARDHALETAKSKITSSNYEGVSLSCGKWVAQIRAYGKTKHLGYFDTEIEASKHYQDATYSINNNLPIKVKKHNFSSKHKGVYWNKALNKWMSAIIINGNQVFLGYFNKEIRASISYEFALFQLDKLKKTIL